MQVEFMLLKLVYKFPSFAPKDKIYFQPHTEQQLSSVLTDDSALYLCVCIHDKAWTNR